MEEHVSFDYEGFETVAFCNLEDGRCPIDPRDPQNRRGMTACAQQTDLRGNCTWEKYWEAGRPELIDSREERRVIQ